MFFISYISGILGIVGLLSGGILLVRQRHAPLARYLSLFTVCAGMWAFANAAADLSTSDAAVIFWSGTAFISFNFFTSFFLCFVLSFVKHGTAPRLILQMAALIPSFLLGFFAFSHYSVREVIIIGTAPAQIIPGPLYILGPVFLYSAFVLSYILLGFHYRHSFTHQEKAQARYIVFGSVAALAGLTVFDIILPILGELRFFTLGPLTTAILITFTAYAVFRYDLAAVNKMIQRSVTYATLTVLVTALYTGFIFLVTALFQPSRVEAIVASAGITVLVGLLAAPRLERTFQRRAAELENRVRERTAELAQLQESQTQMILDLSHGLQTPLTIMRNELDLVADQIADKKNVRAFRHSIEGLSRFVYDLLRLARSERAAPPSVVAPSDISAILREIVEYFEVLAHAQGVFVEADIHDDIRVPITKGEFEEVVTNLLGNAMKHVGSSPTCLVHVALSVEANAAQLQVRDTGAGIPAEDLPHVFEKFYRSPHRASWHKEGAGLGLAICKRIVESRGGTIRVDSVLGVATTFTVTLPCS